MKDSRLRYVFSNPMFQEFLGRTAEQIEEQTDSELWPESTAARIRGATTYGCWKRAADARNSGDVPPGG